MRFTEIVYEWSNFIFKNFPKMNQIQRSKLKPDFLFRTSVCFARNFESLAGEKSPLARAVGRPQGDHREREGDRHPLLHGLPWKSKHQRLLGESLGWGKVLTLEIASLTEVSFDLFQPKLESLFLWSSTSFGSFHFHSQIVAPNLSRKISHFICW